MSCHVTSVMSYYFMSCYVCQVRVAVHLSANLHSQESCHVMSCHVMSLFVTLCNLESQPTCEKMVKVEVMMASMQHTDSALT